MFGDDWPSDQYKENVLVRSGWAKMFVFRRFGWDEDGYRYAKISQDREQIMRLTKHDWLTLEKAYESQMYLWEE